jgi:hypothetical protein
MKIPVFVSCPTSLSKDQETRRKIAIDILDSLNLEPRALGRSDYPADLPLREVLVIARHCAGGVILGFNQFTATTGLSKPGTKSEAPLSGTANVESLGGGHTVLSWKTAACLQRRWNRWGYF